MIIRIFKTNYTSSIVIFFIIVFSIWIDTFFNSAVSFYSNILVAPFYNFIYLIISKNIFLSQLFTFILLIISALLINNFVADNDLATKKNTFIPALIYVLLMSSNNKVLCFHPVICVNLLLIISLNTAFKTYGKENSIFQIYNIGFLISVASMFFFPVMIFTFLLYIYIFITRVFSPREWICALFGILTPYLFLAVYYFWINQLNSFFSFRLLEIASLNSFHFNFNYINWITFIIITAIIVISIFLMLSGINERIIKLRKYQVTLIWFLIISFIICFFLKANYPFAYTLIFIPATIFISNLFINLKRKKLNEIIFFFFLIAIYLNKFLN